MKKILFTILNFIIMINIVSAFEINVDDIDLSNQELISSLDTNYKIETTNFSKENTYNEDIINTTKSLIDITFKDVSLEEKMLLFNDYIYINPNDGFDTLGSSLFIKTFLDKITNDNISYETIKIIRTITCDEGILSFTYLPNSTINDTKQDIVIVFWFKENNNSYKVHMPWITTEEEVQERFNLLKNEENNNNVIGGTFKAISLTEQSKSIDNEYLKQFHEEHKNEVCQINALYKNEITSYGSCFFIEEGIIATSWSFFLDYLTSGTYLYINDYEDNAYNIDGVISANIDYDLIILKLSTKVGHKVSLADSSNLKTDDYLFMINSLNNVNSTITYGTYVSSQNDKIKSLFLMNKSNIGSALYNESGQVVAFVTGELLNSELSYANSTKYIIKLQNILSNTSFENINYTSLDLFKNRYYHQQEAELIINNIPSKIWNKYKKIGNLENTINLKLIKANYEDNIISLRYKNNFNNSIDTLYILQEFIDTLEKDNYQNTLNSKNKIIYKNKKYKIIIKNSMDYLCILIMEN